MWTVATLVVILTGIAMIMIFIAYLADKAEEKSIEDADKWREMKIGLGVDPTYDEHGRLRHR